MKFSCLQDFKTASEKELVAYALHIAEKIRDENLPLDLNVISSDGGDIHDCKTYRCIMGWMLYFAGMPATLDDPESEAVNEHYISILGKERYKSLFGMAKEGILNERIERLKKK